MTEKQIIGYWETDTSKYGAAGTCWRYKKKQTKRTEEIEYTDGEKIWFEKYDRATKG